MNLTIGVVIIGEVLSKCRAAIEFVVLGVDARINDIAE